MEKVFEHIILRLKVIKIYLYDLKEHLKYYLSYQKGMLSKESLRCSIMLLNHQLEKAQTYSNQKKDYGKEKVALLIGCITEYIARYSVDDVVLTGIYIIKSHLENVYSYKDDKLIREFNELNKYISFENTVYKGGVDFYSPHGVTLIDKNKLYNFFNERRSCRVFSSEKITRDDLGYAIKCAKTAPSACNRQTTRVHVYDDKITIKNIIFAQNSDIEWCLNADKLLIITTNKYYYRNYLERNQGMFDSGLFSMQLHLAFHNIGIGSCFKMAQKDPKIEINTKRIASIPESEDIDVLLLIGKYKKEPFIVAKSIKIDDENMLYYH